MIRALLFVIAALFLGMGCYLILTPHTWYELTPGVAATGPFNGHFVSDIGLAFIASGAIMSWGAATMQRATATAGAVWPILHALLHIEIWFVQGLQIDQTTTIELVAIQVPAWLSLWAASRLKPTTQEAALC